MRGLPGLDEGQEDLDGLLDEPWTVHPDSGPSQEDPAPSQEDFASSHPDLPSRLLDVARGQEDFDSSQPNPGGSRPEPFSNQEEPEALPGWGGDCFRCFAKDFRISEIKV